MAIVTVTNTIIPAPTVNSLLVVLPCRRSPAPSNYLPVGFYFSAPQNAIQPTNNTSLVWVSIFFVLRATIQLMIDAALKPFVKKTVLTPFLITGDTTVTLTYDLRQYGLISGYEPALVTMSGTVLGVTVNQGFTFVYPNITFTAAAGAEIGAEVLVILKKTS